MSLYLIKNNLTGRGLLFCYWKSQDGGMVMLWWVVWKGWTSSSTLSAFVMFLCLKFGIKYGGFSYYWLKGLSWVIFEWAERAQTHSNGTWINHHYFIFHLNQPFIFWSMQIHRAHQIWELISFMFKNKPHCFFARQDLLFAIFDVLNISTSVSVYMSLIFMRVSLIHMDYFYF